VTSVSVSASKNTSNSQSVHISDHDVCVMEVVSQSLSMG
jgi:hypothetical protein